MRLDKFLKVSRLIKRRTLANQAAGRGRVSVNGKQAKPSFQIREGDIVEIIYGKEILKVRVLHLLENLARRDAEGMYEELKSGDSPQ